MKKLTNFETLVYFSGATTSLISFLLLEAISFTFNFRFLLAITILLTTIDIFYFKLCKREKTKKIRMIVDPNKTFEEAHKDAVDKVKRTMREETISSLIEMAKGEEE